MHQSLYMTGYGALGAPRRMGAKREPPTRAGADARKRGERLNGDICTKQISENDFPGTVMMNLPLYRLDADHYLCCMLRMKTNFPQ